MTRITRSFQDRRIPGSPISGDTPHRSGIPRLCNLRASNIAVHLPATGGPPRDATIWRPSLPRQPSEHQPECPDLLLSSLHCRDTPAIGARTGEQSQMESKTDKPEPKDDKDSLKTLAMPELMKKLGASADGLTQAQAVKRQAEYGPNQIEEKKTIENPPIDELLPSIIKGYTDTGLHTWLSTLKKRGQYHHVSTLKDFTLQLPKVENIFFYFSGHGYHGQLVLPSNERISIYHLITDYKKLFFVLDCCDMNDIGGWTYLLSRNALQIASKHHPSMYPFIGIVPIHSMPITSSHGSQLTRELFDCWSCNQRQYFDLPECKIISSLPSRTNITIMDFW